MLYPASVTNLIAALSRLPGIGPKTAQRLALYLLGRPRSELVELAKIMLAAKDKVSYCSVCGQLTEVNPCAVCTDPARDRSIICVVEEPQDVVAIERTKEYHGLYHVLGGALSPLEGIGPEELRVKELLARLRAGEVRELVVATDPNVEGDATALYLARLVKPLGIKVTHLARGLPVGGDLEYADEITLGKALA
ncbi:MAG: recombination protein RecR, partial [Firmicutes bacterium]|nr:recombination protein RecR [Bacillota bacterium]